MAKKNNVFKRSPLGWIMIIILVFIVLNSINIPINGVPKEITYGEFYSVLKNNPASIKTVVKRELLLQGEFTDKSAFLVNIPDNDTELLNLMRQNLKSFDVKPPRTF